MLGEIFIIIIIIIIIIVFYLFWGYDTIFIH